MQLNHPTFYRPPLIAMTYSPHGLTRRSVLGRCAQTAAFAAAASTFGPLLADPGSRWFKIGALDGCLGKQCDPAALDVAKQIGLDGVQVDFGRFGGEVYLLQAAVQNAYREAVRRTGLEIASLSMSQMNSIGLKNDPRAAKALSDSIDVCHAFKLPVVLAAFFYKGDLDIKRTAEIDRVVQELKPIARKAEKARVTIGLENYLSAEDNMRIIERVGSPAVKVYYDVGNSTDKGRDVAKEIRTLGTLICEFHAKDGEYMLGQGRIDFKKVRQAIDDAGYSGWIQIEAAQPHGLIPDYTADRKYLKGIFPARL
jgi:sugar phosphate isomerase/epimerase